MKEQSLNDVINGPGICTNCAGKGKVVVRIHNTDKVIDCPVCQNEEITKPFNNLLEGEK